MKTTTADQRRRLRVLVNTLRSGRFAKCSGGRREITRNGETVTAYSAAGLALRQYANATRRGVDYDNIMLNSAVAEYFGVDNDSARTIINMNDNGRSFATIAAYIERNFLNTDTGNSRVTRIERAPARTSGLTPHQKAWATRRRMSAGR